MRNDMGIAELIDIQCNEGKGNMRIKNVLAGLAVAGLLALAPVTATAANADTHTEHVGGGLWQWGHEGGTVFSNYHHASKYHTATACNAGALNRCSQVAAAAGVWARAETTASWMGGNTAYWNTY